MKISFYYHASNKRLVGTYIHLPIKLFVYSFLVEFRARYFSNKPNFVVLYFIGIAQYNKNINK